jgi:protein required for attachment to host cells
MVMKRRTWLLVANSSIARLFEFEKGNTLVELGVFEHPESRMKNSELVSDRPGREFESMGTVRHAMEPKTFPKQVEFAHFAKTLAEYLRTTRNQNEFDTLYIAASPTMLGLLRQALDPAVAKLIKGEVDKDITHLKTEEIFDHLPFFF